VTRGVALNHLVGREFQVGEAILRGLRLCEPCAHLERLTHSDVIRGLTHRGGLRAQILIGGAIKVGDRVVQVASQATSEWSTSG
jgi:MOSC domain-containing protein YiiM